MGESGSDRIDAEAGKNYTRIALVPPAPKVPEPDTDSDRPSNNMRHTVASVRDQTGEEFPVLEGPLHDHFGPGMPIPGTRYRIVRWLGNGGMGVVYEAEHVDIERRVAIKILRREVCQNPEILSLFREEARAAGRIGAENIAEIYDFDELADGRLMYAMELLDGSTVGIELENGPMTPARVISVGRQLCKGLAEAHRAGIVHRDIKPENIVLGTKHRRRDVVKILDFGIAAVLDDALQARSKSAGTPEYLGPEAVMGLPFDGRLDQYAVGCTLYEMLTGEPPFDGDDVSAVMRAQVDNEPIPPSKRWPGGNIPTSLDRVVLRCLAKDPARRYPNMCELEAALCQAQIDAGIQTEWDDLPLPDIDPERRGWLLDAMPDPGMSTVSGRPLPRNRRGHWAVAAVVAAMTAATVGVGAFVLWPEPASQPAVEQDVQHPITTLTRQARAAAARSHFVLPSTDGTEEDPAFEYILQLEQIASPEAFQQAQALRNEFATTLIRLGDELWDQQGGKPFAAQYYAQALVFDPDNQHAQQRAALHDQELENLQQKAQAQDFSEQELQTAERLADLARSDRAERRRRIAARQRAKQQSKAEAPQPESERPNPEKPERSRSRTRPKPAPKAAPEPEAEQSDRPRRDPERSRALVGEANDARQSGRQGKAKALFEQALGLDPSNASAHAGLSDIYFNRGSHSRAVRHAERAVRIAPSNATYRIKLGDAYFKVLHYEQALKHYERAAKLGRGDVEWRIDKTRSRLER